MKLSLPPPIRTARPNSILITGFLLISLSFFQPILSAAQSPVRLHTRGHYLADQSGKLFFWLGDTGWLLFSKLTREEAEYYLEQRRQQGFNVIQAMLLHELSVTNIYSDSALIGADPSRPRLTAGHNPDRSAEYDYWDHVDYIVRLAASKGIYIAMVPIWGSNVKKGQVSGAQAASYARFLALRYRRQWNIVWLNGGDIRGSDHFGLWNTIGKTLRKFDHSHLISFHPFGRRSSSEWFHHEAWLDFNMFQSGHRNYQQDTATTDHRYGEDNYLYMQLDWSLRPVKPSFDGEPSYEDIPHGLHDTTLPRWTASDVRRYAYWSVFSGGAGFTYGNNNVMQMHKSGSPTGSYGSFRDWKSALGDTGATQMIWLKKLVESHPDADRVPAQELLAGEAGNRYNYIAVTRGKDFIWCYTYTGRPFSLRLDKFPAKQIKAYWYDPRNGSSIELGRFTNKGEHLFDPPGEKADGNDWVLVLEKMEGH